MQGVDPLRAVEPGTEVQGVEPSPLAVLQGVARSLSRSRSRGVVCCCTGVAAFVDVRISCVCVCVYV